MKTNKRSGTKRNKIRSRSNFLSDGQSVQLVSQPQKGSTDISACKTSTRIIFLYICACVVLSSSWTATSPPPPAVAPANASALLKRVATTAVPIKVRGYGSCTANTDARDSPSVSTTTHKIKIERSNICTATAAVDIHWGMS